MILTPYNRLQFGSSGMSVMMSSGFSKLMTKLVLIWRNIDFYQFLVSREEFRYFLTNVNNIPVGIYLFKVSNKNCTPKELNVFNIANKDERHLKPYSMNICR